MNIMYDESFPVAKQELPVNLRQDNVIFVFEDVDAASKIVKARRSAITTVPATTTAINKKNKKKKIKAASSSQPRRGGGRSRPGVDTSTDGRSGAGGKKGQGKGEQRAKSKTRAKAKEGEKRKVVQDDGADKKEKKVSSQRRGGQGKFDNAFLIIAMDQLIASVPSNRMRTLLYRLP